MEVKEFIKTIKEELPTFLPDEVCQNIEIDDVEVAKMNDQKLHGLTFRPKGSDAAPTIYVDDLYERHENGEDMGFLLVDLAKKKPFHRRGSRHKRYKTRKQGVKNSKQRKRRKGADGR